MLDNISELFQLANIQWLGFFLTLVLSLIFTPIIIKQACRYNIVDNKMGGRHIHKYPVPRLGGIAIYLSCLVTSLFFIILYGRYTPAGFEHFELLGILIGATLIFLIGLFDDLFSLSAWIKLIAQIFTATIAWFCNVKVLYILNPLFIMGMTDIRVLELNIVLSFIITVGWLVLITNALNLIDGLDGLAGGVALITGITLWTIFIDPKIMQPSGAILVATLSGGILGFLRMNYNPARIFLGDSGAYFLGFTLGAIAVAGLSGNPNTASIGSIILLAFSFPLIDTAFTIFRRLYKGRHVFAPDKEHIHHRFLSWGFSTKATMFIIYGTCILLGLIANIFTDSYKRYIILVILLGSLALLNTFWTRKPLPSANTEINDANDEK